MSLFCLLAASTSHTFSEDFINWGVLTCFPWTPYKFPKPVLSRGVNLPSDTDKQYPASPRHSDMIQMCALHKAATACRWFHNLVGLSYSVQRLKHTLLKSHNSMAGSATDYSMYHRWIPPSTNFPAKNTLNSAIKKTLIFTFSKSYYKSKPYKVPTRNGHKTVL